MSTRALRVIALSLLVLAGVSCSTSRSRDVVLAGKPDDRQIQEACDVTARTCTRCHDFDRVLTTRFSSPHGWRQLVARMRYMNPGSIADREATQATTCLVYRAFGQRGLDDLAATPGRNR